MGVVINKAVLTHQPWLGILGGVKSEFIPIVESGLIRNLDRVSQGLPGSILTVYDVTLLPPKLFWVSL